LLLRKRRLLACVVGALPVGLIVGGCLWLFFPPLEFFGAVPEWAGMIGSSTISSLIAVAVDGYFVVSVLSRPIIIERCSLEDYRVLTKHDYARNLSSLVKPMISSKLKPNASKTCSKVDCK
jgi:hypothetical protein